MVRIVVGTLIAIVVVIVAIVVIKKARGLVE